MNWDAGSEVRLSHEGLKHYSNDPEWRAMIVGDRNDPIMIGVKIRGQKKTRFINRKYLTPCSM